MSWLPRNMPRLLVHGQDMALDRFLKTHEQPSTGFLLPTVEERVVARLSTVTLQRVRIIVLSSS